MKDKVANNIMKAASMIVELVAVSYSVIWALVLLMPGDTFDTSPVYQSLGSVASEELWGILFALIAYAQLFSLGSNKHRNIRRAGHLVATGIWFSIAAMFMTATPITTGATYFVQAALTGFLYWKEGMMMK